MNTDPSIKSFFSPKGVAIIGASRDPNKLGYGLSRNLKFCNYKGAIHFVNPKGGELLDLPVYKNIMDVPDPVDLAVILIPARFVPQALDACGKRGIHAAIIGAGGFREASPEGAALEDKCLRIAQHYNIRLLGPNCVGLLDTHLPIDATFLPPPGPTPGDVAFISQSGAICAAVIDWARGQGYGISRMVSLGNQLDICESDMLEPFARDPFTNVLALYMEGVKDGRDFVEQARSVTQEKPIIALKVGRFESGQRAVSSHTGAMAGEENAYNAAFRRAGVLRAMTSEGMFDRARALAWCSLPEGRRVAVVTNAGGPGVTAADSLESHGLKLADFSDETQDELQQILPPAAGLNNPVDMLAAAGPDQFASCTQVVLSDPGVDSVMVIYPSPPMYTSGAVAKALIPVIHNSDKPVVVVVMGDRLIQEAVEHLRAARIPEYRFPERASAALSALVDRSELLEFARADPVQVVDVNPTAVNQILNSDIPASRLGNKLNDGGDFLSEGASRDILEAYGIPVMKMVLAQDASHAAFSARELGFPVAMKIASPEIQHKSDIGGVILNLGDETAVRSGFDQVMDRAGAAFPDAEIQGVHIQRMVPPGQEVIVGAIQDSQFGAMVMFGSGGTEVEGLKDVSFGLAPLTMLDAEHMLNSTWAGRRLGGFRNLPPADRTAVLDVLYRLAQLSADHPDLLEIEINPLRVMPVGGGVVAVDLRIKSHPS